MKRSDEVAGDELLLGLLEPTDQRRFRRLLHDHPELLSAATHKKLEEYRVASGLEGSFRILMELLDRAKLDPDEAFARFRAQMSELNESAEGIAEEIASASTAVDAGHIEDALAAIERLIPVADRSGLLLSVGALRRVRGNAYLRREAGSRAENLETAIAEFDAALELASEPSDAAGILMNLGLAHGERLKGDRRDNLEAAVDRLRAALDVLPDADASDLRRMIRTNLATALLRREAGDQSANAREAVRQCTEALRDQSSETSMVDWAHTQLTLGAALERSSVVGDADVASAERAYAEVVARGSAIPERWLVGAARLSLGMLALSQARVSADEIVDAHGDGALDELFERDAELRTAEYELREACELLRDAPDQIYLGRALAGLADVSTELEDDETAIAAGKSALSILRPSVAPRASSEAAAALGAAYSKREDWEAAAAAYRIALEGADIAFESRLDTSSRIGEIQALGRVPRWAAFAFAKAGDLREAAIALETGRTRELRRRFRLNNSDQTATESLPAKLRDDYIEAAAALAESPMGPAEAEAGRRYQEVLRAIRQEPGLEHFHADTAERDLDDACEHGWPLIYVNPTPAGTLVLRLMLDEDGARVDTAQFLDVSSTEIFMHLMTSAPDLEDAAEGDGADSHSYLLAISGEGRELTAAEFRGAIEDVADWLGPRVARPLYEMLPARETSGVTLVLCGPLAAAPLHAAAWESNGSEKCLLDHIDVRYAASASLAATARRRAGSRGMRGALVALGDPTQDLPAAQPEVQEIAAMFAEAAVACHDDADSTFLRAHAEGRQFIHLACHARGGLFDGSDSAVLLSDGPLSIFELSTIDALDSRMVAISACQSGLSDIAQTPDEVLSIGTAVVAAGAACAIVSLWPVDDLATAMLMVRLYEEICSGTGTRPPEALGRAQRWLRQLSIADEATFLAQHPTLQLEFERRRAAGHSPGDRRGGHPGEPLENDAARPFRHIDLWAAFVAIGS